MRTFLTRLTLIGALIVISHLPISANAHESNCTKNASVCKLTLANADQDLQPGDKGYRHTDFHGSYQAIFNSGRCNCHTGECRPTRYRIVEGKLQMILNRKWVDIPDHAIQPRESVPANLWAEEAHICAFYVNGILNVECAIVTGGM